MNVEPAPRETGSLHDSVDTLRLDEGNHGLSDDGSVAARRVRNQRHGLMADPVVRRRVRRQMLEQHVLTVGVVDADAGNQAPVRLALVDVLGSAEDALVGALRTHLLPAPIPERILVPHHVRQGNE